jgi:hypothetical protein
MSFRRASNLRPPTADQRTIVLKYFIRLHYTTKIHCPSGPRVALSGKGVVLLGNKAAGHLPEAGWGDPHFGMEYAGEIRFLVVAKLKPDFRNSFFGM